VTEPLLQVDGLRLAAAGGSRLILDGVALHVAAGETVGLVGESGSGKSMTARAVAGLLPEGVDTLEGSIRLEGRELLGLRERQLRGVRGGGVGALLQDPFTMLNPLLKSGQHISETLPAGRYPRSAVPGEVARRLAEVGIRQPSVADRHPFELSGGMRQRVALAAALAKDPRLLIADEPTTALDATTQRQILALLRRLQTDRGMGLLLITHDLRVAFSMCDRVYIAYAGSILEEATPAALRKAPAHPYTVGLLRAEPAADRRQARLRGIPGRVPRAADVTTQCPFADRCPHARDVCRDGKPPLLPVRDGQHSACRRFPEIAAELVAEANAPEPGEPAEPAPAERHGAGEEVLTVRGLVKRFGRRRSTEPPALAGVDVRVLRGRSTGVVGESGSGKTTLARCVLGLETPSEGTILLDGVDVSRYDRLDGRQLTQVRRAVQCVFQDPYSSLNPAHTVGFILTEAARLGPAASDPAAEVDRLLDLVGLPRTYAGRRPSALSGGERQRVAIARALAPSPQMLVCDEPVAALDVSVQAQVLEVLRSVTALGVHLLFITHDLAVVRQMTDDIVVLERGVVVESGPTEQVLDDPQHPYTRALLAAVPSGRPDWLAAGAEDAVPGPGTPVPALDGDRS
jgi:peptide/nickel transport system ATP-binding protein